MAQPTLQEMLKAGVHFGHRASRRHPKMDPYIFAMRNGVHILDLEQTQRKLVEACDAARALSKEGKIILFVGTKDSAKVIVREQAMRVHMPYVIGRWLGGTMTNYAIIGKVIQKYRGLVRMRDTGEMEQKYTKHEQAELGREIVRLEIVVGGISDLNRLPDALFVVDVQNESTAVREAVRKEIATFAICDTNVDPTDITYPIPANDDAVASIRMLTTAFADAVAEGAVERAKAMAKSEVAPEQARESAAS
ncbi:MAG: 30S ribosomal protein S2 [bacterium]|nr:30S ribosomal protein S2 [bacterium]